MEKITLIFKDILINKNDLSKGIYFIIDGEIEISHRADKTIPLTKFDEGSYIGEFFFILENLPSRYAYTISSEFMSAFFLPKEKIMEILQEYPTTIKNFKDNCLLRMLFLELNELRLYNEASELVQIRSEYNANIIQNKRINRHSLSISIFQGKKLESFVKINDNYDSDQTIELIKKIKSQFGENLTMEY